MTTIYTDASHRGPLAGWAWYIDPDRWSHGASACTSSLVAEVVAIAHAVTAAPPEEHITIAVDSVSAISFATDRGRAWQAQGWVRGRLRVSGDDLDLLQHAVADILDTIDTRPGRTEMRHVHGHGRLKSTATGLTPADIAGNAAAHWLANLARTHGPTAGPTDPGWTGTSGIDHEARRARIRADGYDWGNLP